MHDDVEEDADAVVGIAGDAIGERGASMSDVFKV